MLSALSRMIQQNWLGLTILLAIVTAFVLLRSPATRLASGQELDALLVDGAPKVVEFYSDFWSACLVAKPIVDGLENELQGRARVMRLNVLDSVGMNAARRFEVRAVPTFIVFDGQGGVVETQIGIPNRAKIVLAVDALSR